MFTYRKNNRFQKKSLGQNSLGTALLVCTGLKATVQPFERWFLRRITTLLMGL